MRRPKKVVFFIMEILILISLLIITLTVLVLSYIERKDLIDRLMSKDIVEYKSLKEEENVFEEDNPNLVSVFDAKEEIMNESK